MIKFKNWLHISSQDVQRQVSTNPGSGFVEVLRPVVKDNGDIELVVEGKTSLYDQIQSFKDSVDINRIIQRFVNGDQSALNARAMQFFDATEFPTTYAEMLNVVIKGRDVFDGLPFETKEKFGNDYYKFIAQFGSESWFDAFGVKREVGATGNESVSEVSKGDVTNE